MQKDYNREFAANKSLQEKIDELEFRLDWLLRKIHLYESHSQHVDGLSDKENQVVSLLMARRDSVTTSELMDFLYGDDPDGGPERNNIISVFMFKIRKKLKPKGIIIETTKAPYGYYMPEESKKRIEFLRENLDENREWMSRKKVYDK